MQGQNRKECHSLLDTVPSFDFLLLRTFQNFQSHITVVVQNMKTSTNFCKPSQIHFFLGHSPEVTLKMDYSTLQAFRAAGRSQPYCTSVYFCVGTDVIQPLI